MLAYGLKKTLSNEEENEYAVQNGIYSTSFYFDENDRVYKIACGTGVQRGMNSREKDKDVQSEI